MSSALGISAVTAVLQYWFNQIYGDLGPVSITAVAPDVAQAALGADTTTQLQVNLFLHQVTLNSAWRNMGLPSLAADGSTRLKSPPLALDLHYLMTVYSTYDTGAEALLGYGVQFLHDNPVLTRAQIGAAFSPNNLPTEAKNPLGKLLGGADLAQQIEMIKITPATLGREEMAWLWTALKADYRPTFPFQASVVLIQTQNPVQAALPVLSRTVTAQPNVQNPFGVLTSVVLATGQSAVSLGDTVTVNGANLLNAAAVVLTNDRLGIEQTIAAVPSTSGSSLQFVVPNPVINDGDNPTDLPAGVYTLCAQVKTDSGVVYTNSLAMAIAPTILDPGSATITPDAEGNATMEITCSPYLRPGQQVSLLINAWAGVLAEPIPFTDPTNNPTFSFSLLLPPTTPTGKLPLRLRVDGIDSPIIGLVQGALAFVGPTVVIQ